MTSLADVAGDLHRAFVNISTMSRCAIVFLYGGETFATNKYAYYHSLIAACSVLPNRRQ